MHAVKEIFTDEYRKKSIMISNYCTLLFGLEENESM